MPNWCNNYLTIRGNEDDIKAFKKQANNTNKEQKPLSFEAFVQMPKELKNIQSPPEIINQKESASNKTKDGKPLEGHEITKAKSMELKNKFGADNWYDWNIQNWGTKWDASYPMLLINEKTKLKYGFDTAWGPPIEWMIKTSAIYPKLTFTMKYDEPGMGFSGTMKVKDEKILKEIHKD